MAEPDDGAWFAPKRFGYGASWPIAWQGWALVLGQVAAVLLLIPVVGPRNQPLFTVLMLAIMILPMPLMARKTRGGWRWRSPGRDAGDHDRHP